MTGSEASKVQWKNIGSCFSFGDNYACKCGYMYLMEEYAIKRVGCLLLGERIERELTEARRLTITNGDF